MEYSKDFKDNIPYELLSLTSDRILSWIMENRDKYEWAKDPNAYEMTNLFLFTAKYKREGKQIDTSNIEKIWEIRNEDFKRCNIFENNYIYKIVQDSYESAIYGKSLVNDSKSHNAIRKLAGIGLYLYQQKRDKQQISYNNPQELLELLSNAKSLSKFHPELYKRYAVQSNINRLCELQLTQDITQEVQEAIKMGQKDLKLAEEEINTVKNSNGYNQQEKTLLDQKNRYIISKMKEDTQQIFEFINEREEELLDEFESNTPASNYYYSLNFELSHIGTNYSQVSGNIGVQLDYIMKKYNVNLDELLNFAQQSRECMEDVNSKRSDGIYKSLQNSALEYFNNRKNGKEID